MTFFHIRRQLRRARGNQFYKDRSNRYMGTYCGADATGYDVAYADRNRVAEFNGRSPCPGCVSLVNLENELRNAGAK